MCKEQLCFLRQHNQSRTIDYEDFSPSCMWGNPMSPGGLGACLLCARKVKHNAQGYKIDWGWHCQNVRWYLFFQLRISCTHTNLFLLFFFGGGTSTEKENGMGVILS